MAQGNGQGGMFNQIGNMLWNRPQPNGQIAGGQQNVDPNAQGQAQNPMQRSQSGQQGDGATNDPESMQNPIDVYKDLWANPTQSVNEQAPQFKVAPEMIEKVTAQLDFSQNLPPELTEKLQSGEQLNAQDIMAAMNHVGRATYAKAVEHLSHLTGTYVDLHSKHSQKGLPSLIKNHLAQSKISNIPAVKSNPALQEHLKEIGGRIAQRYPDASEDWVAEQASKYFVDMARSIDPDAFTSGDANASGARRQNQKVTDWDAFFNGNKEQ